MLFGVLEDADDDGHILAWRWSWTTIFPGAGPQYSPVAGAGPNFGGPQQGRFGGNGPQGGFGRGQRGGFDPSQFAADVPNPSVESAAAAAAVANQTPVAEGMPPIPTKPNAAEKLYGEARY
ncbi:hypothetical protein PRIPAC_73526 [Pristionchus pacificus]|uniref:Uncharacterized protein n=1 Tax=Pristionchus pacificus TaxID=54126 RepID=A0A2A6CZJ3_PRIPA|nr:hypothetical protein PRIPAC_73526 [Pristionchus pacificus]|eukprot:PDM83516.1 hypothetical protein PRIPAC_30003 [Pristionchus pacificus]